MHVLADADDDRTAGVDAHAAHARKPTVVI